MYALDFTEQAKADLAWFQKNEQNIILDSIEANLRYEPMVITRNRKPLRPNSTATWELRVGKFRVCYNVAGMVQIVRIERVGLKLLNRLLFRGEEGSL